MLTEKRNNSFLIWLVITIFYCYQSILRLLPNIISHSLMVNFNITASKFGFFSSAYYIGYIVFHIPMGIIISRVGVKIIIPICMTLTAVSLLPLIYPLNWNSVLIGRIFTGMGSSAAAIGALQVFRITYPLTFTRMLGLMVSVGLIIAVYVGKIIVISIVKIGAEAILSILMYSSLLLAIATYFIIPKSPEEKIKDNLLKKLKSVTCNYKLFFTSFFSGLMLGPLEGFADAWGSIFLITIYDIDKVYADHLILSIFIGMSIGCIILPYIAEKTGYYFGVTIASGIILFICFYYMLSGVNNIKILDYLCITIGIFSSYQVVILARISYFFCKEQASLAGSVANMIIMLFGCFFHNSIGFLLDILSENVSVEGIKYYSANALIKSIAIIPSAIIVGLIGLLVITLIISAEGRK